MLTAHYRKRHDGVGAEVDFAEIMTELEKRYPLTILLSESDLVVELNIRWGEIFHRCSVSEWEQLIDYISKTRNYDVITVLRQDRRSQMLRKVMYPSVFTFIGMAILTTAFVKSLVLIMVAALVIAGVALFYYLRLLAPPTPLRMLFVRDSIVGAIWLGGIVYVLAGRRFDLAAPWTVGSNLIVATVLLLPPAALFVYYLLPEIRTALFKRR